MLGALFTALLGAIRAFVRCFGRVADAEARRNAPGYFSPEYRARMASGDWRAFRKRVLRSTLGRDVVFPILRATQVDHLSYRTLGHERIWIDVVPLNPATHRLVTTLRDAGLRGPVNAALRFACGVWLAGYATVFVAVIAAVVFHDAFVREIALLGRSFIAWALSALTHVQGGV